MPLDRIIPKNAKLPFIERVEPEINEEELNTAILKANEGLQEIQRQIGRKVDDAVVVRFPRGYLIEIGRWRLALQFMRSPRVMNNVAYTLMMYDVQTWLIYRTDLAATAKDMVIKSSISALGSIAEAIVIDSTSPPMGKRQKMYSRIDSMIADRRLKNGLDVELKWLWDTRNRQHLFDLTGSEFSFYESKMLPRAEAAIEQLILTLQVARK